ncbi:glucocorticoid receptor-like (DNA-binding domain), partial [Meredithblackwellia eburnea MCA 4105]
CTTCGTSNTPLWRRDAEGKTICNACGLYQKNRRAPRPVPSTAPSATPNGISNAGQETEVTAMECFNCQTRTTPLWRRDGEGRVACNACGLYYKLHNAHRPVNMKKPTIKRRKRVPAAPPAQVR